MVDGVKNTEALYSSEAGWKELLSESCENFQEDLHDYGEANPDKEQGIHDMDEVQEQFPDAFVHVVPKSESGDGYYALISLPIIDHGCFYFLIATPVGMFLFDQSVGFRTENDIYDLIAEIHDYIEDYSGKYDFIAHVSEKSEGNIGFGFGPDNFFAHVKRVALEDRASRYLTLMDVLNSAQQVGQDIKSRKG